MDFDADGTIKSVVTEGTVDEADAVARVMPELIKAAQAGAQPAGRVPEAKGPLLFDQIDKYLEEQKRGADWTPQTVQDAAFLRTVLRRADVWMCANLAGFKQPTRVAKLYNALKGLPDSSRPADTTLKANRVAQIFKELKRDLPREILRIK